MFEKEPLFSAYRQGENRITGSLIAVLQRIDSGHVARLLRAASGQSELPYVSFTNQPARSAGSVPDAEIQAGFRYLFEVKTVANGVRKGQLEGHLAHLKGATANERVFVISPDPVEPGVIKEINDERVVWFSFRDLDQAVTDLLGDGSELISEQEQFLLTELRALFAHEGLLDHRDVVIVAARQAYPEYRATNAYVCQPGRAFRHGIERLGFYAEGEIKPEVPKILYREDNVIFSPSEIAARAESQNPQKVAVGALIARMLSEQQRADGEPHLVFLLSPPDSPETIRLERSVVNDKVDKNGKRWAWTLGQAYANVESLRIANSTSELDAALARTG